MGGARVIGLISDTHGLVRPDVFTAFEGVDAIYHAGDVGGSEVLAILGRIAPVQAVLGNADVLDDPRLCLHFTETVGGLTVHVSHGHELGNPVAAPPARPIRRGRHRLRSHPPAIGDRSGRRLVVNPGAAGPRRFSLMPSVARLTIRNGWRTADIIDLSV